MKSSNKRTYTQQASVLKFDLLPGNKINIIVMTMFFSINLLLLLLLLFPYHLFILQISSGDRRNSQTPPFSDGTPSPSDREVSMVSACDSYLYLCMYTCVQTTACRGFQVPPQLTF